MQVASLLNLNDPYNRRVLPGVLEFAARHGWHHQIVDLRREAFIAPALQNVNGILLGIHDFEHSLLLARTQVPSVCWSGSLIETSWRRVTNDNVAVGRAGADHLLKLGFRNFAFYQDAPEIWAIWRREAFHGRLEAQGLKARTITAPASDRNDDLVKQLLDMPRPFGTMLAHDSSALRFMAACHEAGLSIPDDVAVIGVNDDDIASALEPPLSSIPLQTHRTGYEAASLLHQLMKGVPGLPWSIVLPPDEIIVRKSSDTIATGTSW